jgi:hypothetical protein
VNYIRYITSYNCICGPRNERLYKDCWADSRRFKKSFILWP